MNRTFQVFVNGLLLSLLLSVSAASESKVPTERPKAARALPDRVEGEFIVKYRSPQSLSRSHALPGVALVRGLAGKETGRRYHLIHIRTDAREKESLDAIQGDPGVEYVQPNYIYRVDTVPNDPSFDQQWAHRNTGQNVNSIIGTTDSDMDSVEGWDVFKGNGNVTVAVLDTGVDLDHPDLAGNIWTNPGETPDDGLDNDENGFVDDVHGWDFFDNDNDPRDYFGHGTHVAGIIGAVGNNGIGVAGVAWNVKIMPLKVMGVTGFATTATEVAGIQYAIDHGAKIINASLGGSVYDAALKEKIDEAGAAGVLFVAAAGNDGKNSDVSPTYPASYDSSNILSVANTTQTDGLASSSNYGLTRVDLGAPGSNILSLVPIVSTAPRVELYSTNFDGTANGVVPTGWVVNGTSPHPHPWTAHTTTVSVSLPNVLEDSPDGNYGDNANSRIWLSPSPLRSKDSTIEIDYRVKYDLENKYDYLFLVGSDDIDVPYPYYYDLHTGVSVGFESISVTNPALTQAYELGEKFGFCLFSDESFSRDGVKIDDVKFFRRPFVVSDHGYAYYTGTSMAAPQVAGLASLVWGLLPKASLAQVRDLILSQVDAVPSLSGKVASGGRANVQKTMMAAQSLAVDTPTLSAGFVGASSIAWTWSDLANETGYRIRRESDGANLSGDLPAGTTSWVQMGLTPNTRSRVSLEAFNSYDSKNSASQEILTLSLPPTGTSVAAVYFTSATLTWSPNGNSDETIYRVVASTDDLFYSEVFSGKTHRTTLTGLLEYTTYSFRVQAINGDAVSTVFDNTVSTRTRQFLPAAPGVPVVLSLTENALSWSWVDASDNELGFRVRGASDGINLSGDLPANTTEWVQKDFLNSNTPHQVYVESYRSASSANSGLSDVIYTLARPPVDFNLDAVFITSAAVSWSPNLNRKGTVYVVDRSLDGVHFAPVATSTGLAFVPAGLLPQTTYYFRVRAENGNGLPTAYTDALSFGTPSFLLTALGGEGTFDLGHGWVTFSFPPGAFLTGTSFNVFSPVSLPAPHSPGFNFRNTGNAVDIQVGSGAQPARGVSLTFDYLEGDIAGADERTLVVARFDPVKGFWLPLPTVRDPDHNRLTAVTDHFSLFQVMSLVPAADVSSIKVFPNPFRPSANGVETVTFSDLPAQARLSVYTLNHDFVAERRADASGVAVWDATNDSGERVVSGIYLVRVDSDAGAKTMKIAVQR